MSGFDPNKHLISIRGKGGSSQYLEVKWRLVWFRDRSPHGLIDTEAIEIDDIRAVFRAVVTAVDADGTVTGRATGYGSETKGDFGDFIEKAESKAIGRALAHLGYGTQFAGDAEAPAEARAEVPATLPSRQPPPPEPVKGGGGITEPQVKAIKDLGGKIGLDVETLQTLAKQAWKVELVTQLSKEQAAEFIDELQEKRRLATVGG